MYRSLFLENIQYTIEAWGAGPPVYDALWTRHCLPLLPEPPPASSSCSVPPNMFWKAKEPASVHTTAGVSQYQYH